MSRSNHDKPFYVDVGTSIVAIRCPSNHDVIVRYDHSWRPSSIEFARTVCDRMKKEVEIHKPRRNCDVGTAEEQHIRFRGFCRQMSSCSKCPISKVRSLGDVETPCETIWTQMTYEEGVAK